MGDWRMMGSAMRRRMGAPSHHRGGSSDPFINLPSAGKPNAGRPHEPDPSIWDRAAEAGRSTGGEESASQLLTGDAPEWARNPSSNHPSMRQRRMRPEGRYFG